MPLTHNQSSKWFLSFPGQPEIEINPHINQSIWKDERNDQFGFVRKVLGSDIIIKDDKVLGTDAWSQIKSLEERGQCSNVTLRVQLCVNGAFQDFWLGYIPFKSGNYDYDQCKLTITPKPDDVYRTILDGQEKKKNLLLIPNRHQLQLSEGDREDVICTEQAPSNPQTWPLSSPPKALSCGYSSADGWIITKNELYGVTKVSDTPIPLYRAEIKIVTQYSRQVIEQVASPGPEWTEYEPGKWAKPSNTVFDQSQSTNLGTFATAGTTTVSDDGVTSISYNYIRQVWTIIGTNADTGQAIQIDNALDLGSILSFYYPTIPFRSDFFGIDPDGTAPSNGAYSFAASFLQELFFLQASDVVLASAFQNATRFEFDFKNFWEDIKLIFNIILFWDNDNSVMRIEHVSYQNPNVKMDFTIDELKRYLIGRGSYSYDEQEAPIKETFAWKYQTGGLESLADRDFDGGNIDYDPICANGEPEDYIAKRTVTNLAALYDNDEYAADLDKIRDVMVILSTTNGAINSMLGPVGNEPLLNGPLAWSNLLINLHFYERPLPSGVVNDKAATFFTSKYLKEQDQIKAKLCLDDYVTKWDPLNLVTTQIGDGKIKEASYTVPTEKLEFDPMHS